MKTIFSTAVQVLVILACASAVAVAYNGISQNGLKWNKSYFAKTDGIQSRKGNTGDEPAKADPAGAAASQTDTPGKKLDHIYQVATYQDVVDLVNDPLYQDGLYICVDARSDEHFAEGHIPGARQMFPYYADRYMPDLLPDLQSAEKIIVYCTGGDCEDSIFACREMLDQEVPFDVIYLYEGGINEWKEKGGLVESVQP